MIADRILGKGLGLIDWFNIKTSPFRPFTRKPSPYGSGDLAAMEDASWLDIQNNWLAGYYGEFFWSMNPNDGGDMAIWHGVYTATMALRGGDLGMDRALHGCRVLQGAGADSRLVRGATDPGGPLNVDPTRTYYKRTINGRAYSVLADVSESSIIGHVFGLWMAYRYSNCPGCSDTAALMLKQLAVTVASDGDRLLNPDGTPAKFGDLRPGLTTAPIRIMALTMLYAAAGVSNNDTALLSRVLQLERDHAGALRHPETHFLWIHPWYQDVIAYMAAAVLKDARPGCSIYRDALEGLWAKNKEEGNSFYTYLLELVGIPTGKTDIAKGMLQEFPPAKPFGTVTGSDFVDDKFKWGWKWAKGGNWFAREPIGVWLRPPADFLWQRCPYGLDGGTDSHYNNMDFCAAYWLGKRAGKL